MKKKAIEKIPYLTLPAVSQEKETEYVGVTAVKVIDHEKHLFLEVYQNDENSRNVPLVRIVLTKKILVHISGRREMDTPEDSDRRRMGKTDLEG